HGARVLRRHRGGEPWDTTTAEELRHAFERLGPTYVKLAQLVASSPGLFPEFLAEEFRACLDEVPPIAFATVREIVVEELGEPLEDIFTEFEPAPLASASIGQVHRARLRDGTTAAVKVQRPGIRARLEGDLRILHRIARILERTSMRARMARPT